jgi:hypothetical protein
MGGPVPTVTLGVLLVSLILKNAKKKTVPMCSGRLALKYSEVFWWQNVEAEFPKYPDRTQSPPYIPFCHHYATGLPFCRPGPAWLISWLMNKEEPIILQIPIRLFISLAPGFAVCWHSVTMRGQSGSQICCLGLEHIESSKPGIKFQLCWYKYSPYRYMVLNIYNQY